MITIQQIYNKCGWEDVETYAWARHEANQHLDQCFSTADPKDVADPTNPHGALYRQIGATTWMAAHAAAEVMARNPILILSHSFSFGKEIAAQVSRIVQSVTGVAPDRALIKWVDQTGFVSDTDPTPKSQLFHDFQWKERLVRRLQGPFAMTREIRYEAGKYVAYAEDDERLMTLAPDGLMDFMVKHPNVVAAGWAFDKTGSLPLNVTPTLRGAMGFGTIPTVNKGWTDTLRDVKKLQATAWARR